MTDEKSVETGCYYFVSTSETNRKDVKMTKTNARTPQFLVEYDGKIKVITIGIGMGSSVHEEWPYELAKFIKLKLNPPKEVYLNGWFSVNDNGELSISALESIQAKAKRKFFRKISLAENDDSESDSDLELHSDEEEIE